MQWSGCSNSRVEVKVGIEWAGEGGRCCHRDEHTQHHASMTGDHRSWAFVDHSSQLPFSLSLLSRYSTAHGVFPDGVFSLRKQAQVLCRYEGSLQNVECPVVFGYSSVPL